MPDMGGSTPTTPDDQAPVTPQYQPGIEVLPCTGGPLPHVRQPIRPAAANDGAAAALFQGAGLSIAGRLLSAGEEPVISDAAKDIIL
jgi:hypothetical protein